VFVFLPSKDLLDMDLHKCDFCNVTKLKVLLHMHSSLDEHLYEINYSMLYTKVEKFMIIARAPRLDPEACRGM
jgi:hypothetical protein